MMTSCNMVSQLEPIDLKQMRLTCKSLENDVASLVMSHITICSYAHAYLFSWQTGIDDPLWLQENIWKAISLLPNLRHFRINSLYLVKSLRNFDSLKTLESIDISGDPFEYNGLFFSVSRLYASSSNLSSITIKNPEPSKVYSLFSSSPKDNPAHHLRCLALSNIPVHLDKVSLSHLTSLKLSSLRHITGSRPDDIWVALEQSKVCLEELKVGWDVVDESLYDFLCSFSGLKKLKLSTRSQLPTAELHLMRPQSNFGQLLSKSCRHTPGVQLENFLR